MEQRLAKVEAKLDDSVAQLREEIRTGLADRHTSTLKWMFGFWISSNAEGGPVRGGQKVVVASATINAEPQMTDGRMGPDLPARRLWGSCGSGGTGLRGARSNHGGRLTAAAALWKRGGASATAPPSGLDLLPRGGFGAR
jgi:hypothetical protein